MDPPKPPTIPPKPSFPPPPRQRFFSTGNFLAAVRASVAVRGEQSTLHFYILLGAKLASTTASFVEASYVIAAFTPPILPLQRVEGHLNKRGHQCSRKEGAFPSTSFTRTRPPLLCAAMLGVCTGTSHLSVSIVPPFSATQTSAFRHTECALLMLQKRVAQSPSILTNKLAATNLRSAWRPKRKFFKFSPSVFFCIWNTVGKANGTVHCESLNEVSMH